MKQEDTKKIQPARQAGFTLIELSGLKYGRLTVLNRAGSSRSQCATWKCKCDCGATVIKRGVDLRSGNTKSCGCLRKEQSKTNGKASSHKRTKDISNKRFGRLVAIHQDQRSRLNKVAWLCLCDCGNLITVESDSLASGNTKSCGCLKIDIQRERTL